MPLSVPRSPAPRYAGPVPVLTTAEAARIPPLLEGRPDLAAVALRLKAATEADPVWQEPHP